MSLRTTYAVPVFIRSLDREEFITKLSPHDAHGLYKPIWIAQPRGRTSSWSSADHARGSRPRSAPGSRQARFFCAGLLPDDLPLPLSRCADRAFPRTFVPVLAQPPVDRTRVKPTSFLAAFIRTSNRVWSLILHSVPRTCVPDPAESPEQPMSYSDQRVSSAGLIGPSRGGWTNKQPRG